MVTHRHTHKLSTVPSAHVGKGNNSLLVSYIGQNDGFSFVQYDSSPNSESSGMQVHTL